MELAWVEGRPRGDETNSGALRVAEASRDRDQPTAAVVVRQRDPGRHALHVVRWVQVITLDELDAERVSEHRTDQGLAGPAHAHHHVAPGVDSAHEVAQS